MKKLFTILLAMAMILAIGSTVLAAENTTLTITGATDREYVGYKLLNLTTSLNDDADHTGCDDGHDKDCYNYAYTVNETYRAILQAETFENTEWDVDTAPANAAAVTDEQILKYLEDQTSDGDDGSFNSMRDVADRIYRAILADGTIDPEEDALTGTNDEIEQGYWLFADVTDLDDENQANSLVMVDTKGEESITINTKIGLPTVEKKVKDVNDSTGEETGWQDAADHDITDEVEFKLTATLPSNFDYYKDYTLIFHDEISRGLTLNANTIKVYAFESLADAAADDMDKAVEVTNSFTTETTTTADGCSFEIGCDDIKNIANVTKDTVFVVYYTANLNANAVIGATGNPNEVYLEYSNNPYEEGTGKTENDKVIVFTYQVTINKVDPNQMPLEGAGFTLYKYNAASTADDKYEVVGAGEIKGDGITTFNWVGLDDGNYKLVESTVPAGYNKMDDIEFTITATHSETADEPALTALDGGELGTGVVDTGVIEETITNQTGTVLPETGAMGTMLLIGGGALLVVLAAVFMITRKKMSVYAD